MDLKTLRYFVVIAEELNITRASKILMMSQPPLSNQIKNLEEELHTTLFIRGKRSLQLTEEGKFLYRKAKDILAMVDKTESDISLMNKGLTGTISMGISKGIDPALVSSWVESFNLDNPHVDFRIFDEDSDGLIEKMRLGIISVAAISSPFDQSLLNSIPLMEKDMKAYLPSDHPLAKEEGPLPLSMLVKEKLIVPLRKSSSENIRKWFRKTNQEPNVVIETDRRELALSLVGSKQGIAIFPQVDFHLPEGLLEKSIEGQNRKIQCYFVWRKGHQLSPIEERFIDLVKGLENE